MVGGDSLVDVVDLTEFAQHNRSNPWSLDSELKSDQNSVISRLGVRRQNIFLSKCGSELNFYL